MAELPNWHGTLVHQRDPDLGCIPTGIEWMLRYRQAQGIQFDTFQDEFNLQARGVAENNFGHVPRAVRERYPATQFEHVDLGPGRAEEKFELLEQRVDDGVPSILSVSLGPEGGWHIAPVVSIDAEHVMLLWFVHPDRIAELRLYPRSELVRRHREWRGGSDFLALKAP